MNYQEFRQFRDRVTAESNLLRLDCMNPSKALSFLKYDAPDVKGAGLPDVLAAWHAATGTAKFSDRTLATTGVTDSLQSIFTLYARQGKTVWLPNDVYPVYWDLAQSAGLQVQAFSTLGGPDFSFVADAPDNAAILLPNPLIPVGRYLNDNEVMTLQDWCGASSDRRLVIDAVYTYQPVLHQTNMTLVRQGNVTLMHSLSKGWIEAGVFGGVISAEDDVDQLSIVKPTDLSRAMNMLQAGAGMPSMQQSLFTQEWKRLQSSLETIYLGFQPPESGYFAAIPVSAQTILGSSKALAIPASVFGSPKKDWSIVTCLYDMKAPRLA